MFIFLLSSLVVVASAAMWTAGWMIKRPIEPSGGLYVWGKILLPGPHFFQDDPAWAQDKLGPTSDSLAEKGCAVASAAMVLASYGVDTDPGRLNAFLNQTQNGYTPEGWLYWETAAKVDPALCASLLPHYENAPSFFLIDWNLIHGNPVIIRLRHPNGVTHFMVVCGKLGWDYLVRDPGSGGKHGVYRLKDFGGPIEALRFYKNPNDRAGGGEGNGLPRRLKTNGR